MVQDDNSPKRFDDPIGSYNNINYEIISNDVVYNVGTSLNNIPGVFFTSNGNRVDRTSPPLLELCNLSLAHYRISADLASLIHAKGHPLLAVSSSIPIQSLVVGAHAFNNLGENGSLQYAEANASVESFLAVQADLETKMANISVSRLYPGRTASDSSSNAMESASRDECCFLISILINKEKNLEILLKYACMFTGLTLEQVNNEISTNGNFVVYDKDYSSFVSPFMKVRAQLDLYNAGLITARTAVQPLVNDNILSDQALDYADQVDNLNLPRNNTVNEETPDPESEEFTNPQRNDNRTLRAEENLRVAG